MIIKAYCLKNPRYFQVYAEQYASDQEAFFKDYAEAHAKLSSLGSKFDPAEVSAIIPCLVSQHWAALEFNTFTCYSDKPLPHVALLSCVNLIVLVLKN
jgi:hypothetical protein